MPKNKNAMICYLYLDKLFQRQGYSIDEILDKLNGYLYNYDNSSVSRRVSSGRSSQLRVRSEALSEERDSAAVVVLIGITALIVCVGATNIINFMDGINGITAGYSLAVLVPLALKNGTEGFVSGSLIVVAILSVLVFSWFNFRPKNKAKCFAGDVGSVGMAFILLFLIGCLIMKTGDVTWLAFLLVYGVDGCCTILHRIMLHEHLGEAHRKHAYQLMANELGMSHVAVSLLYMGLQLAISLAMVYLVPDTVLAHWIYLVAVALVLVCGYVVFMKKYYHLHAEYLESLKK